jgi:hypothetical protein
MNLFMYLTLFVISKRNQVNMKTTDFFLRIHCTENSKQIFPELKLRGRVPDLCIHVSVSDLYIPTIGLPVLLNCICRPIMGIYKLLTDT